MAIGCISLAKTAIRGRLIPDRGSTHFSTSGTVPPMPPDTPAIPGVRDVVLAVIVRDRRVLIAQRRQQDAFGGLWELPGGKRQTGESILDCLSREVMEELGVRIRPGHAFPPIHHTYPDKTVRLLAIACIIEGNDEPHPLAADRLEWATAAQLSTYPFPAANAPLMEQIITYLATAD
jgi:mutator protein MutT